MAHNTWVFGPFVFDPRTLELRREGQVVPLQAQPARVLALLLGRAGQIVTRDEIRDHIWGETHVDFDRGLNFGIRRIRAALGEDASAPVYLETLPRRGYRWMAPVRASPASVTLAPATPENLVAHRSTPARPRPRRLTNRQVPLWAAAALTLTAVLSTLSIHRFVEPVDLAHGWSPADRVVEEVGPDQPSRLRLVVDALHCLSHAFVDGRETPASARALRTLEIVALSQFGLASDADLP